jgi:hypothetical protein
MYFALQKPVACDETKAALRAWARDTLGLIIASKQQGGTDRVLEKHDKTSIGMIGSWKKVVFFIKTDWTGVIGERPITLLFKVDAAFHISGMYKADIMIVPEIQGDHWLQETPVQIQDAIIDMTAGMDRLKKKLVAESAKELQGKVVEKLLKMVDEALSCRVVKAISPSRPPT